MQEALFLMVLGRNSGSWGNHLQWILGFGLPVRNKLQLYPPGEHRGPQKWVALCLVLLLTKEKTERTSRGAWERRWNSGKEVGRATW